jgi:sugar O-acyltransferase (sialic acid O-acetyltransferase NeuD family)
MLKKVVIICAGGFGREVLDIFLAENAISPKWKILGFIDENPKMVGKIINGYPILGSFDYFDNAITDSVMAIVAVGDNRVRKALIEKAERAGLVFCNAIHPSVIYTPFISFGKGIVIAAGAVLTNLISIGNHVIINLNVTIGHDVKLEDFVNINPGANINGNNTIREGAFIGSGAVTIQNIEVGCWSIVGAGAVVISNIPDGVVAVGFPAKPLKHTKVEDEYENK